MPRNVQEAKPQVSYDSLLQRIRTSLADADSYTQRQKRLNSRLMIIIIFGSALAAFITALTAVEGPTVIPGLLDWKVACTIGAVLSFVTTVCSGLSQQLNISQKLVLGSQCVGRLRALELVAATQTRALGEITNEYAEILRTYAEAVE
jgi:hypothetical protein